MPTVTDTDVSRMRELLFFDGPEAARKSSRFWMLIVLAGIIASAGVIGDSTATVIGAMIVAPLMTPILGIVLAIVLADRYNLTRSILLVIGGALAVIALAWVMGSVVRVPVLELTNSQVSARVSPRIIDLVAALATGAVGAFALCRSDISDTLPGVAIAISLVPPLAVVGLTLESGSPEQAAGALLLFGTNVAAILASGIGVMTLHGVHTTADSGSASGADGAGGAGGAVGERTVRRGRAITAVVAMIVLVAIPLAATSSLVARTTLREQRVTSVAEAWASDAGWEVKSVTSAADAIVIDVAGDGEPPDGDALRAALDADGLAGVTVRLELIPETRIELPGS